MNVPNPLFAERIVQDLKYVLGHFPTRNLLRLRSMLKKGQVIRGNYVDHTGNGCVFNVLSRGMPEAMQIDSKSSLIQFFTGYKSLRFASLPEYQPAKYFVKLWDGSPEAVERYGTAIPLSECELLNVLNRVIQERLVRHEEERQVRSRALARLQLKREAAGASLSASEPMDCRRL